MQFVYVIHRNNLVKIGGLILQDNYINRIIIVLYSGLRESSSTYRNN